VLVSPDGALCYITALLLRFLFPVQFISQLSLVANSEVAEERVPGAASTGEPVSAA
jgi:hypothetical protein